jgi:ribosome biogenesis GTPase
VCFLSGQRAVIGDRVSFEEAQGSGGKLIDVLQRRNALARSDPNGREQVLAANIGGLLVVTSVAEPPFRAGLVDRYLVAAGAAGLPIAVVLNKTDLGVPADVEAELALREAQGVVAIRTGRGVGIGALQAFLAEHEGAWALVGHSAVGKTSLVAALCPELDVGPVAAVSDYWGTGRHTTTASRIFAVAGGGEVVDSPGIRSFAPAGLAPDDVRQFFPGMFALGCHYRDCRHREDEEGCVAAAQVPEALVASYRRLLTEIEEIDRRSRR